MGYDKTKWKAYPVHLRNDDPLTEDIRQQASTLGLSVAKYLLLLARAAMRARQGDTAALAVLGIGSKPANAAPQQEAPSTAMSDDNDLADALLENQL